MAHHAHTLPSSHRLHMPLGARQRPLQAQDAPTLRRRIDALLEAAQGGLLAKFDLVDYTDTPVIQVIEALLERPGIFGGGAWDLPPDHRVVVELDLDSDLELMAWVVTWAPGGDATGGTYTAAEQPAALHHLLSICATERRAGRMGLLPPIHTPISPALVDYFLGGRGR